MAGPEIGEQMGRPARAAADPLAAKADAARGLFRKAGLVVDDKEPTCWVVRRGDEQAAPLWLFWPMSGAFRSEQGDRAGYGAYRLIEVITKGTSS
jgi:hypothetical protein